MIIINNAAFCNMDHAIEYGKKGAKKAEKKENARKKREFYENHKDTRRQAAVRWFNRFIRLRDTGNPCISCGKPSIGPNAGKFDAGHYIPAGSCSALKFNEKNVNLPCHWNCNIQQSGNRTNYRKGLIKKYGLEEVEKLEGPQPIINITVDWYKSIEEKYKAKCKELEKKLENVA